MNEHSWEKEYSRPTFLSKNDEPQAAVLRFIRWLKKETGLKLEDKHILDLGSGTGRNANYFATLGNHVCGMEISLTAMTLARKRASEAGVEHLTDYVLKSIGKPFPFKNSRFDIAFDVTSSTTLTEAEREGYLTETHRVLKKGGYFFVRALCKDGDENAKQLIKISPGPEKDTYIMPETRLTERVFSKADFISTYGPHFSILELERETHYPRMNNRVYRRNFWIAYLQKN